MECRLDTAWNEATKSSVPLASRSSLPVYGLSPLHNPRGFIHQISSPEGPAERSSSAPANRELAALGGAQNARLFPCGAQATLSPLIMVIQSRLNVQTFSFNGIPRQPRQNYLPPPSHSCKMMALTFPVLLRSDFSGPQFIVMSQISSL